jgi:hypothetical protein
VLLPEVATILHSHWTNKYSLLNVSVEPGVQVTVEVADAVVESTAVVVPVRTAVVSSVLPDAPLLVVDFQIRHLIAPVWLDTADTARTRNANDQLVFANVPVNGFSERQHVAGVNDGVARASVAAKVVEAFLNPTFWAEKFGLASLATVQPVAVIAPTGAVPPSCKDRAPLLVTSLK